MNNKRAARIIILIAYVLIICLSGIIWFFVKSSLDSENYENRELAPRPLLAPDTYDTFSSDYTAYFNDNLQFRNYLVSLNSAIDYFCFGRSSNSKVIIGKDNWLFYASVGDGDPISCYKGTNLHTEEELSEIAQNCVNQRDFVESLGKEFVIFIAPNKERIYPEYMPERYGKPAENYATLQIYNYLKENTDLRVVYPYTDLMDAKDKLTDNIWFKTDTHWNFIGGYIGASALMRELNIDMPLIYSDSIHINTVEETSGDLAGMLNLSKQLCFADSEYTVDGYDRHDSERSGYDFFGLWSYHATNADPRTIYVIRDSFSSHMADYIGSQFSESYLRHIDTYTYDDLTDHNPDIVVYETVERYADGLGTFSIQ